MPLSVLGLTTIRPGFTGNVGVKFHLAALPDGRYVISGPSTSAGETVFLYAADGTLERGLALGVIGGQPGLSSALGIAALPDGRFLVSGLIAGAQVGYVVFAADGTPVGYDDGGVTRFTRPVFGIEFFDGAFQAAHRVAALPDGRLLFAWTSTKDEVTGPVGNRGGLPINEAAGGGPGRSLTDVRAVFVDADGVVGPELLVTQGQVDFPSYVIESRFGRQSLHDLDLLPDGGIVVTYMGDRYGAPLLTTATTAFSPRFPYASLRIIDEDGAPLVGETPLTDAGIAAATADRPGNPFQLAQTIQLADGRLAGFFGSFSASSPSLYEIHVRFFTAAGTALGEAEKLDIAIDGTFGRVVQVAAQPTADGGFVVLHNGDDGDLAQPLPGQTHMYLARYDAEGAPVERIRLTDTLALWEIRAFEIGPDGDFIAAITPSSDGLRIIRLVASAADDMVLTGTPDDDTEILGPGDDWYDGLAGDDTVRGGEGDDRIYGNAGDDALEGGPGDDVLDGGLGDDTLVGGPGNDTLRGGPGADVFVIDAPDGLGSVNRIVDFDPAEGDLLDLSALGITDFAAFLPLLGSDAAAVTITVVAGGVAHVTVLEGLGDRPPLTQAQVILAEPANRAPVARDDSFDVRSGIVLGPANLLANDEDPDGDPIEVVGFGYSGEGTLSVLADGSFEYRPASGFSGTDRFTYVIRDSFGAEASATVLLDVGPPDEPPLVLPAPTIAGTPDRDRLVGTPGDDVIDTLAGNDVVFAGAGDDVIVLGAGRAQVHGGPGADLFVLHGPGGTAIIYDLDVAAGDRLDIADPAFRRGGQVDLDLLSLSRAGSFTVLSGRIGDDDVPLASLRGVGGTDLAALFGLADAAFVA